MWVIGDIGILIWLFSISVEDWKTRRVKMLHMLPIGIWVFAVVVVLTCGTTSLWSHFMGFLLGIFFLFVSWVSKQQLGLADGIVLFILGCYVGAWKLIVISMLAFGGGFLFLFVGSFMKKITLEKGVPFVPFLFVAYGIEMMFRYV